MRRVWRPQRFTYKCDDTLTTLDPSYVRHRCFLVEQTWKTCRQYHTRSFKWHNSMRFPRQILHACMYLGLYGHTNLLVIHLQFVQCDYIKYKHLLLWISFEISVCTNIHFSP
jgi:hypothetical protein